MKFWKKLAAFTAAMALTVTLGVTASARGCGMGGINVQAAANVTGQSLEELREKMTAVNCMGTLMAQQGLLEEFQGERLRLCEERLNNCISNGSVTQEQADSILERIKERQALCNGAGNGLGLGMGLCDGSGQGNGGGQGYGMGNGLCDGSGQGNGGWGTGRGRGCGRGQGRGCW